MPRGKKKIRLDIEKNKAFLLYKSWKKVYCPALKAHVYFTRWGWNHLVNKKYRKEEERIKRLKLLVYVKYIVERSLSYAKNRKVKEYDMYEIVDNEGDISISVIIVKKNNKYYFLSVMNA